MKNLLLFFLLLLLPILSVFAQTDRELLLEVVKQQAVTNSKVDKLAEQLIELSKQQAVMAGKSEVFEKAIDKRFEDADKRVAMIFYTMLAVLAGIFELIGFIIWDRQVFVLSGVST